MWLPAVPGCPEFYYYGKPWLDDLSYTYEIVHPEHLEYMDLFAAYEEMNQLFNGD